MNKGIIMICGIVIVGGLFFLNGLRRNKKINKWVIKAHSLAALLAITWAILTVIEEIWKTDLSNEALSYLRHYGSIIFGLCGGIILTLWMSGQLITRNEDKIVK